MGGPEQNLSSLPFPSFLPHNPPQEWAPSLCTIPHPIHGRRLPARICRWSLGRPDRQHETTIHIHPHPHPHPRSLPPSPTSPISSHTSWSRGCYKKQKPKKKTRRAQPPDPPFAQRPSETRTAQRIIAQAHTQAQSANATQRTQLAGSRSGGWTKRPDVDMEWEWEWDTRDHEIHATREGDWGLPWRWVCGLSCESVRPLSLPLPFPSRCCLNVVLPCASVTCRQLTAGDSSLFRIWRCKQSK